MREEMKPNYFRWNMPSPTDWYDHSYWMGHLVNRTSDGLVYIVNVGENYYKIGKTTNIRDRIKQFQASNPYIAGKSLKELIVAILTPAEYDRRNRIQPTASMLEVFIHDTLYSKGLNLISKGCSGSEIFRLSEDDLRDLYEVLLKNGTPERIGRKKYYKENVYFGGIAPRKVVAALLRKKKRK